MRKKAFILQIFLCFIVLGISLIAYLEKQNDLTDLRLYVPRLVLEIKGIQEENAQLKYQIQQFESPDHLIKMAAAAEFSHLKHPLGKEILVLQDESAVQWSSDLEKEILLKPENTLAVGAK